MSRPHTLFTGQWVDLTLEQVAAKAAGWGFDGLEIACDPRHFDVERVVTDRAYLADRKEILERHGLRCWAISAHMAGQSVCDDPIDDRHRAILPAAVWGDGNPESVRRRAADRMKLTADAAFAFGVDVVVGFSGSAIWPYLAMFPPVPHTTIDAGYQDFADRWTPILNHFAAVGVKFALEVHPSEIAYDYWSSVRALDAINDHPAFGFNWDPSHLIWQHIDPKAFIYEFRDRIFHVDCKDTKLALDGRNGILGSHLPWGDPRRGFDFVSVGHGDVPWEACLRMLTAVGYRGPISVEWEDSGMNRDTGAEQSLAYLRALDFDPSSTRFDDVFANEPGQRSEFSTRPERVKPVIDIGVILGSTRPMRKGKAVADWVVKEASGRDDARFELIDLADHPLPHLDEPNQPALHLYTQSHSREWSEIIAAFDGYVFVTPESTTAWRECSRTPSIFCTENGTTRPWAWSATAPSAASEPWSNCA